MNAFTCLRWEDRTICYTPAEICHLNYVVFVELLEGIRDIMLCVQQTITIRSTQPNTTSFIGKKNNNSHFQNKGTLSGPLPGFPHVALLLGRSIFVCPVS